MDPKNQRMDPPFWRDLNLFFAGFLGDVNSCGVNEPTRPPESLCFHLFRKFNHVKNKAVPQKGAMD